MSEGMNNPSQTHIPLRIERMSNGGFVVTEAPTYGLENGRYCGPLFASTTIGEALAFIALRLEPEKAITLPVEATGRGPAFEVGKRYRTRDGRLTEPLTANQSSDYPLKAKVERDNAGWRSWASHGQWHQGMAKSDLDLLPGAIETEPARYNPVKNQDWMA